MKPRAKKRRQWQHWFLTDYLQARYSGSTYYKHVPLGSIPEELQPGVLTEPDLRELQAARCLKADAVVIKPEKVTIIKARIVADRHDLIDLLLYGQLFRYTRQFVDYWDLPIELQYVCAVDNNTLREITSQHNIEMVNFEPEWLPSYFAKLPGRKQRPVRLNISDYQPARSCHSTAIRKLPVRNKRSLKAQSGKKG